MAWWQNAKVRLESVWDESGNGDDEEDQLLPKQTGAEQKSRARLDAVVARVAEPKLHQSPPRLPPRRNPQTPAQRATTGSVQREIDETITAMHSNVEKVIQRGENLQTLQGKASDLERSAAVFHKASERTEREIWWSHKKMILAIGFILFTLLVILALWLVYYLTRLSDALHNGNGNGNLGGILPPSSNPTSTAAF